MYYLFSFCKKIKLYNCVEGHKPWCTLESQRTTLQRQLSPLPPPIYMGYGAVSEVKHITHGPSSPWVDWVCRLEGGAFFLVFLRADLSWQVRRKGDGIVSTVVSFPTTGKWNGRPSRHSLHYPTEVNRGATRASALRGTWRTRHEHGISSRTVFLKKANSKSHGRKYESKPNWVHLQNNSYL